MVEDRVSGDQTCSLKVEILKASLLGFCLLSFSPSLAATFIDTNYPENRTLALSLSERAQEEIGYASGFSVADVQCSDLFTPNFEMGARIRYVGGYGPASVFNFATYTGLNVTGPQAPTGFDRPIIRARQLIYGNFRRGRWYILELGLPLFNITGFVGEYYHYWSQRIALHEALDFSRFNTNIELGATVRSITQYLQPTNTALIYPPTVDFQIGAERDIHRIHLETDFKAEQSLTSTRTAGSYDDSTVTPYGASTRILFALELGYHFSESSILLLRGADRVYRWPDTDNSALWATFDEATLGRSLELFWRGQW